MKTAQETHHEMELTAVERELALTLASLSPAVTQGVASVPGRELALRAGAVRSKQRLRYWQVGSILVLAGAAAAYVMQPTPDSPQLVASNIEPDRFEAPIHFDEQVESEAIIDGGASVIARGTINAPGLDGPHKIVFTRASISGEITIEVVPQDWELCDH